MVDCVAVIHKQTITSVCCVILLQMPETDMSMEEEDADYTPSGSQPSVGISSHASPKPTVAAIDPPQQQQATGNGVIDVDKEPTAKAKQGRREMASRYI
jgi:hypothetical protein